MSNRMLLSLVAIGALGAGYGAARLGQPAQVRTAVSDTAAETDADDEEMGDGVVALTDRQIEASGIRVVTVGRGGGGEVRLTGRVEAELDARATAAAAVGGRIERVMVAPGSRVKAGQVIAELTSAEGAALRASLEAAEAGAEAARLAYDRDSALVSQGVVARQELEASRARSIAADADVRAAQARLAAAGVPDARGRVEVTSPVAGVVRDVFVSSGGVVAAGAPIAEIADPSRTELVFFAAPALAAQLAPGAQLDVMTASGNLDATVIGIAADVRAGNSATIIRARAARGVLPPAGSAVAARVVTERTDETFVVPTEALQTVEGQTVVFVAIAEGFRATPVLAGRRAGGFVEILRGLSGMEKIAADNAFVLKAELAKGESDHGH